MLWEQLPAFDVKNKIGFLDFLILNRFPHPKPMPETPEYYIIKRPNQTCQIVPSNQLTEDNSEIIEKWGPFTNQNDAIARRVGLIRAGKCQPQ